MSTMARVAAGACGLVAIASLWLPWYQPGGEVIVLFGALDRYSDLQRSAWDAFAWEDIVLAVLSVATVAVAAAGRRWFLVPVAGAAVGLGVVLAHRSDLIYAGLEDVGAAKASLPATGWGFVAPVALAIAAGVLAADRYRLRR